MIGNEMRWYENPARRCIDENGEPIEVFSDLKLLPPGNNAKALRKMQLVDECNRCPVLIPCREDLLSRSKDWTHYGIQAGVIGRV